MDVERDREAAVRTFLIADIRGCTTCDWDQSEDRPVEGCARFPERPFPVWASNVQWSPDGRWIAVLDASWSDDDPDRNVAVWDAETGALVFTAPPPDQRPALASPSPGQPGDGPARPVRWWDIVFTPDSTTLLISELESARIVGYSTGDWRRPQAAEIVGTPAVEVPECCDEGPFVPRLLGFDAAGRLLVSDARSGGRHAPVLWLDPDTFATVGVVDQAHDGSLKGYAISPDGTLLATGSSDGSIRIWDNATQQLLEEIHLASQVQGLAFVDGPDRLLAAPDGGGVVELATSPAELLGLVRGSLTRGFTATECATYGIDPCPTLEEMRGPPRSDPSPAPSPASGPEASIIPA